MFFDYCSVISWSNKGYIMWYLLIYRSNISCNVLNCSMPECPSSSTSLNPCGKIKLRLCVLSLIFQKLRETYIKTLEITIILFISSVNLLISNLTLVFNKESWINWEISRVITQQKIRFIRQNYAWSASKLDEILHDFRIKFLARKH